jgi:hypothetical protein
MAMKFDVNKEVTAKLRFKPVPELGNLCIGELHAVVFKETEVAKVDDKGVERDYEYAGFKVPRLELEFKQSKTKPADPDRYYTHQIRIIGSKKKDGSPIPEETLTNLYMTMWDQIKHIHDAFKGTVNYEPLSKIPTIDEYGPAEQRITQFAKFFKRLEECFNKGKEDKPIFVDDKGKPFKLWMKLVAEYKEGKYLTFPTFVGQGFIERYKTGVPSVLEIKPNETIHLSGSGGAAKPTTQSIGNETQEEIGDDLKDLLKGLEG